MNTILLLAYFNLANTGPLYNPSSEMKGLFWGGVVGKIFKILKPKITGQEYVLHSYQNYLIDVFYISEIQ